MHKLCSELPEGLSSQARPWYHTDTKPPSFWDAVSSEHQGEPSSTCRGPGGCRLVQDDGCLFLPSLIVQEKSSDSTQVDTLEMPALMC